MIKAAVIGIFFFNIWWVFLKFHLCISQGAINFRLQILKSRLIHEKIWYPTNVGTVISADTPFCFRNYFHFSFANSHKFISTLGWEQTIERFCCISKSTGTNRYRCRKCLVCSEPNLPPQVRGGHSAFERRGWVEELVCARFFCHCFSFTLKALQEFFF